MESASQSSFCCPITELLTLLSAKWTVEILRELCIAPTRTRRFLAHVPGLTMKSLRQRLQKLEDLGYVHRQQFDERPLKVVYTITDKGRKLVVIFNELKRFADDLNGRVCTCPMETATESGCADYSCPSRREVRYR